MRPYKPLFFNGNNVILFIEIRVFVKSTVNIIIFNIKSFMKRRDSKQEKMRIL